MATGIPVSMIAARKRNVSRAGVQLTRTALAPRSTTSVASSAIAPGVSRSACGPAVKATHVSRLQPDAALVTVMASSR